MLLGTDLKCDSIDRLSFYWSFDNQFTATIHITAKMWSLAGPNNVGKRKSEH